MALERRVQGVEVDGCRQQNGKQCGIKYITPSYEKGFYLPQFSYKQRMSNKHKISTPHRAQRTSRLDLKLGRVTAVILLKTAEGAKFERGSSLRIGLIPMKQNSSLLFFHFVCGR